VRLPRKRDLATALAGAEPLARLARAAPWRGTLGLGYHRIAEDPDDLTFDPGLFSATRDSLDRQLEFLRANFDVVSPEALEREPDAPGRRIVVTFDDGYRDNYELALPLLKRHGIPAAFFLATGYIDEPRVPWWDELAWIVESTAKPALALGPWLDHDLDLAGDRRAATAELTNVYKELSTERGDAFIEHCAEAAGTGRCDAAGAADLWMTWEMAGELRDAGMTIGGHTVSHPVLARTQPDAQRREIEGCASRLREELGIRMRYFAYPVGLRASFDETTKAILDDVGVALAFSLYGGYARPGHRDRLDVPRASVALTMGASEFRAMLMAPRLFARW
jgi:peptidoglycan/xylan/chitin deacetylase (PgdA/CDA1 family)